MASNRLGVTGVRLGLLLAVLLAAGPAWAGSDYSDKDFSVRLPAAFVRFTEVTVLGGQTVANRTSSAINPASAGWLSLPDKLGLTVSPSYSQIRLGEGTNISVVSEAVTWDSRSWGTFQPIMNQICSNRATTRQGLTFDYNVETNLLQWGKRFGDLGVGASVSFSRAEVVNKLGPLRVSESHAENYRFRVGGLYEFAKKWLAGAVFEYGFSPFRATGLAPTPFGLMPFKVKDTQEQYIFRPGISYEYAPLSTVYVDYEYGNYYTTFDRLNSHRFSGGVDHRLLEWLFVRGGASFDARGNIGWSGGLTIFPARWCSLDLGYIYDNFPELRPEFGRSHTVQATFTVRF